MFGKTKCIQCGTVLDGENALKMSGNIFCSENCAEKHQKTSNDNRNCCC